MSIHLVIIDAMNLIRRVHSAQPDPADIARTAHISARALQKIIAHTSPTHIVAVFDNLNEDKGWRADYIPHYKQGRKPMPEALKQGLNQIQDAFMALGVDSLLSEGDEADDLIATLATKVAAHQIKAPQQQTKVTIVSTDKGYCQLLSPAIQIRDYFQERWLDEVFIQKEFGILSSQLTDYWGLVGISATSVSGVPGIGAKSAKTLLNQYVSIEALYEAIEEVAPKWQKKLIDAKEQAFTSKKVASLKTDVLLGFNLQDIRFKQSR